MNREAYVSEFTRLRSEQHHSLSRMIDACPDIHDAIYDLRLELQRQDGGPGQTLLHTALNVFQAELRICEMHMKVNQDEAAS